MHDLLQSYHERKNDIARRLAEFDKVWDGTEERIFNELAFCICTPQSRAKVCWSIVSELASSGLLYSGTAAQLMKFMKPVRFYKTKARRIVLARKMFQAEGGIRIKHMLPEDDSHARTWLVRNVKGLGYKEASHFLRNVGRGKNLMILDRHILRNLVQYGAMPDVPKALSAKQYLEIEQKMLELSSSMGIPASHLDLLFWSKETGEIFK